MKIPALAFIMLQLSGSVLASPTGTLHELQARAGTPWEKVKELDRARIVYDPPTLSQITGGSCHGEIMFKKGKIARRVQYAIRLQCQNLPDGAKATARIFNEKGEIKKATVETQKSSGVVYSQSFPKEKPTKFTVTISQP